MSYLTKYRHIIRGPLRLVEDETLIWDIQKFSRVPSNFRHLLTRIKVAICVSVLRDIPLQFSAGLNDCGPKETIPRVIERVAECDGHFRRETRLERARSKLARV